MPPTKLPVPTAESGKLRSKPLTPWVSSHNTAHSPQTPTRKLLQPCAQPRNPCAQLLRSCTQTSTPCVQASHPCRGEGRSLARKSAGVAGGGLRLARSGRTLACEVRYLRGSMLCTLHFGVFDLRATGPGLRRGRSVAREGQRLARRPHPLHAEADAVARHR
jgi:hypothetical protein